MFIGLKTVIDVRMLSRTNGERLINTWGLVAQRREFEFSEIPFHTKTDYERSLKSKVFYGLLEKDYSFCVSAAPGGYPYPFKASAPPTISRISLVMLA